MNKVKIVGIKTLESGKFNGDTGEMENPAKGTIKFEKGITLREAAIYNNEDAVILTVPEYEALTSGKNLMIPASFVIGLTTLDESLGTVRAIVKDLIDSAKEKAKDKGE